MKVPGNTLIPASAHNRFGQGLAVLDRQPQEEARLGRVRTDALAKNIARQGIVLPIEIAVFHDMGIIVPQPGAGRQGGDRHPGTANPECRVHGIDQACLAGDKATAQTRRAGALRERMEREDVRQLATTLSAATSRTEGGASSK